MKVAVMLSVLLVATGCADRLNHEVNDALARLKAEIDHAAVECSGTGQVSLSLAASGSLLLVAPYGVHEYDTLLNRKFGARVVREMRRISGSRAGFSLFLVSDGQLRGAAFWTKADFVNYGLFIFEGRPLTNLVFTFKGYEVATVGGSGRAKRDLEDAKAEADSDPSSAGR